jgi:multimeric flavodoxin WrbA
MKAFFDSTGGLWQSGALVGKPAGIFVSVATQGGGLETTALTAVTQFAHHGMVFVPTGYSFGELRGCVVPAAVAWLLGGGGGCAAAAASCACCKSARQHFAESLPDCC